MNEHPTILLCGGLIFFTFVILLAAWLFPEDKDLRTLFSTVVTGFAASLFTWLQKK